MVCSWYLRPTLEPLAKIYELHNLFCAKTKSSFFSLGSHHALTEADITHWAAEKM